MNFATTHTAGEVPASARVSGSAGSAGRRPTPQDAVGRQLSIEDAIAAGERYAALALDAAQRAEPTFTQRACEAILAHLRVVRQASGEDLTDVAIAHGARPADARAFGSVFQGLARKGLIRCVGYCLRRKGHSGAGGRIWSLC